MAAAAAAVVAVAAAPAGPAVATAAAAAEEAEAAMTAEREPREEEEEVEVMEALPADVLRVKWIAPDGGGVEAADARTPLLRTPPPFRTVILRGAESDVRLAPAA